MKITNWPCKRDIRSAIRRSQAFSPTRLLIAEENVLLKVEQDDNDWEIWEWHNLRELY